MPAIRLVNKNKVYIVKGTAFQISVWRQLLKIPAGKTLTYKELAKRIGRPKAIRAVANACAANPLPVLIPCHRVIRSDGSLGGYSGQGGSRRKRFLLQKEAGYQR